MWVSTDNRISSSSSFLGVDRILWPIVGKKCCQVYVSITCLSWSEKFNEVLQQEFRIHLQLGLVSRTNDLTLAVHHWHTSDSLSTKLLARFVKWNALLWCHPPILSIIVLEDNGKILTFDYLFAFYLFLIAMFEEIILPNNVVMHTLLNIFHFHSCQFIEIGSGINTLIISHSHEFL